MHEDRAGLTSGGRALSVEVVDGVAVITFDLPGESVNKFTRAVKDEFVEVLAAVKTDAAISAAILLSGKPDTWIAGADIEEFVKLTSAQEAVRLSLDGQELIGRLEIPGKPVVAAIHGVCLGGGLEAALACSYRIASDSPRTLLALPEVQLGIIPGAGGTQRLPRLVGLPAALDMILTGKNVRAAKAHKIGLVDEIVHPAILRDVAMTRARQLAAGKGPARRSRPLAGRLMEATAPGRNFILRKARESVMAKSHGNFPAPLAALDAVAAGYTMSRADALKNEATLFGTVADTEVSRHLIYLFFAGNALKRDSGVDGVPPDPMPVAKIGVLGAGFMGAGIAGLAAQKDLAVRLKDAEHSRVAAGLSMIWPLVEERRQRRFITRPQMADELSLVTGTVDYSGFRSIDVVIEAVFEDVEVKRQVLREVERELPEHAIFATNTSTIPIARIAAAAARPDRVLGMHFFSPVHKMPLLEVIVTPQTDRQVIVTAVALGRRLGKTVIVVNDGPGFYVNRILSPYMNEAGNLLDQGARVEDIDKAMVAFGFPVGPLTLMDEVGLDVIGKAGAVMEAALGERLAPSNTVKAAIAAGRAGRKNRSGFYLYDKNGKKGQADESIYRYSPTGSRRSEVPQREIQERLSLVMLNEAARCIEDNVLRSPRDGDLGAVYGIGFPPFRGGPFRMMDAVGISGIVEQLEQLNHRFPGLYEPADLLVAMARHGTKFRPDRVD